MNKTTKLLLFYAAAMILFMMAVMAPVYCQISQEIFLSPLIGKYVLVTSDGSSYESVIFGSKDYIEQQKEVEYKKALARRKQIAVIKCKQD